MTTETPVIRRRRGIPSIWIIPLIALGICGWLLYSSYRDAGILITIYFDEANGITPGKTQVMSKGIPIGLVQEVHPDIDRQRVRTIVKMDKESEPYLVKDTLFWIVRPELSAARIQGLDTIFSGSYIGIQVGVDKMQGRTFTGLNTAPPVPGSAPGLHISLHAATLGSIQIGTGVYYRNIEIGSVQGYRLQEDDSVLIDLFIEQDYADIVREQSRFCNASGVSVAGKLPNLKVQVESLASLLKGGILLQTPEQLKNSPPAGNGQVFKLYKDLEEANYGIPMTLTLSSAVDIVEGDTKIMYRGIEAGFVKEIRINDDERKTVTAHILLDPRTELILRENTIFWLVKPEITPAGVNNLRTLVTGPHITFKPGGGKYRDDFEILPEPPADEPLRPGAAFVLDTDEAVSFSPQSPVLYKKIQVGEVVSIDLDPKGNGIRTTIFVYEPYLRLINRDSIFWQQSGVEADANLSGVRIRTGPLAELFTGSINFTTPDGNAARAKPVEKNHAFRLFANYAKAIQSIPALQQPGISVRLRSLDPGSLRVGSPLLFKGITIGKVIGFEVDGHRQEIFIDCLIDVDHAGTVKGDTRFYNLSGVEISGGIDGLTMRTGSLQSIVSGGIGLLSMPGSGPARKSTIFPLYSNVQDALHAGDAVIQVTFDEPVDRLKVGAPIRHKGIDIGAVTNLTFTANLQAVVADIRMDPKFMSLFRTETRIWIEEPEVSISGIKNPGAIVFGPYITFKPGRGELAREFVALADPPPPFSTTGKGLNLVLETRNLGSLTPGSPVAYRQVQIGKVTGFTLSPTFQKVYVAVAIEPQFRHIIKENTKFWNSSGASFSAGLFSGVHLETESLETIVRGGIALATPEEGGKAIANGHHFLLHDKEEPAWLRWTPDLSGQTTAGQQSTGTVR